MQAERAGVHRLRPQCERLVEGTLGPVVVEGVLEGETKLHQRVGDGFAIAPVPEKLDGATIVLGRFLLGVQRVGAISGSNQVDHGMLDVARLAVMVGQRGQHRLDLVTMDLLDRGRNPPMQGTPLAVAERAVEVMLEHHVGELEVRRHVLADLSASRRAHQSMATGQSAEPAIDVAHAPYRNEELRCEALTLDGGRLEQAAIIGVESHEPLLDHCTHATWHRLPVDGLALDPAPFVILNQLALLAHLAKEFHQEERVAAGAPEQLNPERLPQPVGLAIEQGITQPARPFHVELLQIEVDRPVQPLELEDGLSQRVSGLTVACHLDLARAKRTGDENPATLASDRDGRAG